MAKLVISDQVLTQELGGEAVLLDLTSGRYFGLDAVGVRVWQLLATHGALPPVLQAMEEEFDVDETTLRRDLDELLQQLVQAGLVTLQADA